MGSKEVPYVVDNKKQLQSFMKNAYPKGVRLIV